MADARAGGRCSRGGVGARGLRGRRLDAAGGEKQAVAKKQTLTAAQKAARKKLLAQAEFLKKNDLNCGCRHHFPAAPEASVGADHDAVRSSAAA